MKPFRSKRAVGRARTLRSKVAGTTSSPTLGINRRQFLGHTAAASTLIAIPWLIHA